MATKKKSTAKTVSRKKIAKTDVKVKTGRKTFSNFVDYVKLHRIASLFIAVALLGILIYGGMIVYEKWQFNKAEKALDSLYTDIVKELGEPTEVVKDKSCAYSSAKYSQGSRSCRVGYLFKAIDDKAVYANKLYLVAKKSNALSDIDDSIYNYSPTLSYSFHFKAGESNLDCSVSVDQSKTDGTYGAISCYSEAKREYYPVNK